MQLFWLLSLLFPKINMNKIEKLVSRKKRLKKIQESDLHNQLCRQSICSICSVCNRRVSNDCIASNVSSDVSIVSNVSIVDNISIVRNVSSVSNIRVSSLNLRCEKCSQKSAQFC